MTAAVAPLVLGDLYLIVCFAAAVGLVGVTVGYCVDHHAEWSRRAAAHRLDAACWWPYLLNRDEPATVQRPCDPSPRREHDRDEAI